MELKEIRITRIKEKMTEHGLNSRELSKRAGISESGISRILTGEIEPRLKTFIKIADALHCDYVWLMGYDEPQVVLNVEQHITEGLKPEYIKRLMAYADKLRELQKMEDET